jgi:predicted RNA-binding protein associated with RNAse of E/G family
VAAQIGRRQTIVERKIRLDGTSVEFTCEALAIEPGRRAVLRYTSDREVHVRGTEIVLPVGTVTIAHFWSERPYNVYHWVAAGRTVAYYVNVADGTEIARDRVAYRDLVVDVVVRPGGALEIVDEDELPADLEPAARKAVADALEVVVTGARRLIAEVERESAPYLA